MKRITLAVVGLLLISFAPASHEAKAEKIQRVMFECETKWSTSGRNSTANSTTTATGMAISYWIDAKGADVEYFISYTTQTARGSSLSDKIIYISSSTQLVVPAGKAKAENFQALVKDLRIVVTELNTSATSYVEITYCDSVYKGNH
ncbi:hypothetical protein LCGC14_0915020 [marine sediment metagenome]|uniref:Uncharacterized protein n=1 Tax=marine sediment metagenome TaxID=412755 RepID=A0A0F9PD87_9ZZZZ